MIVTLLPLLSFLAAALILFTPSTKTNVLRGITLTSSALSLGAVLFIFLGWDHSQSGFQYVRSFDFYPQMGIAYQTGLDGINLSFCLLLAIVSFASSWFALRIKTRLKEYLFHYLFLVGCMFAVFTVLNIFFLYVFYEMTLIPIFAMMGLAGLTQDKEKATIRIALYMTAGAMIGLFGLLHLYDILGPNFLDLTKAQSLLAQKTLLLTPDIQKWIAALIIVGFGVMTTLFPLHSWSPNFYKSTPASLAMLHAGVKIGPYILIRIAVAYLPEGFSYWAPLLANLAMAGILYGGYVALKQTHLRPLAAFSSISHIGVVFLALAAFNVISISASVLFIVAHGLMSACFFALIASLEERGQTDEISAFSGLGKTMPLFAICFMVTALASSGIPGFANFPGELLIFISSWKAFPWAVAAGVFGVLITAIYIIRAMQAICFGPEGSNASALKDISCISEKTPYLILIVSMIILGVFPSILLNVIQPAVEAIL